LTALPGESELLDRARSGDTAAFDALCKAQRDRLWRVVASIAGPSDREDLAQETIIRAFRSFHSYRGQAPFAAWICRIAVNAAHDYQKSAWRRRIVSMLEIGDREIESGEGPHDVAVRREMQRKVRQAVATLSGGQRVAIWLHYFEGFNIAEIARLEQSSESTIRSRVQAGLKRLAPPLQQFLPAFDERTDQKSPKGCEI
jgi:RNA polymerase sigma-70 factor (ECF subfamily)